MVCNECCGFKIVSSLFLLTIVGILLWIISVFIAMGLNNFTYFVQGLVLGVSLAAALYLIPCCLNISCGLFNAIDWNVKKVGIFYHGYGHWSAQKYTTTRGITAFVCGTFFVVFIIVLPFIILTALKHPIESTEVCDVLQRRDSNAYSFIRCTQYNRTFCRDNSTTVSFTLTNNTGCIPNPSLCYDVTATGLRLNYTSGSSFTIGCATFGTCDNRLTTSISCEWTAERSANSGMAFLGGLITFAACVALFVALVILIKHLQGKWGVEEQDQPQQEVYVVQTPPQEVYIQQPGTVVVTTTTVTY